MGSGSPKWRGYWGKRAKKHRLWGFWSLAIPATGLDEGVPTKSPDEEVTRISRAQPSPDSETGTHATFIQGFQGQCPIACDGRGDNPVSPVCPTHDRQPMTG